eukprot:TRINITY_DN7680_c0_g1_i1.p1 TRINITY_DN7680_c0_g1~~TRINITY_DN7680_c0_g1_i1.p1  ORF type:complete len:246 (-),score=54.79 TRINITY_DN7680_c0_g1_i1:133-870(-)
MCIRDRYNMSENPQVSLCISNSTGGAANVWMLLSKHIEDTTVENTDFVALHWSKSRQGRRVYFPNDTDPEKGNGYRGVYINTPHHLVRMDVPEGDSRVTLIASQSRRKSDLNITVQAWSTARFVMTPLPLTPRYSTAVTSSWAPDTSGVYSERSPKFSLRLSKKTRCVFKLLAQPKVATAIALTGGSGLFEESGAYRFGMSVLELEVEAGAYTVAVSTYANLAEACPFHLVVETDACNAQLRGQV